MDPRFDEIADALIDYFDGVHEGDVAKLAKVFLPAAHLYSSMKGETLDRPLALFLDMMCSRPSAASQGAERHDRIISIDFSGPTTAMVKVELAIPPKFFTDYLTMLMIDGQWRIVSKTYEYVLRE